MSLSQKFPLRFFDLSLAVSPGALPDIFLLHKPEAMKTLLFIICMTGLVPLFAGEPGSEKKPAKDVYTLVMTDQNISIYSKWIPLNETVSTRKVKAVFSCNAEVDEVVEFIRSDGNFIKWMSGVSVYNRLKTLDNLTWYAYIRYGLTWPLTDQDCIVLYEVEEAEDGGMARILVTGIPDYLSVKDGVTRIPHMECEWVIRKTGENRLVIEYSQYSRQEAKFPRWIADPIIQKALIKSFTAFKELLENNVNS